MHVAARRLPTWAWVTGLTSAAIVVVIGLAVQAGSGPKPAALDDRGPAASASDAPRPRKSLSAEGEDAPSKASVPPESGTGRRLVYALEADRVWLVDASDKALRSFTVWPGTMDPEPGEYEAGTRTAATTGSDGVAIEHVVYFAFSGGVNFAFSHASDGASPAPAEGKRTAGVRMPVEDGTALWEFASTGTPVVVVP
ncbi:L,D-transpeptidase family protein [Streptomyces chilikensis]|uniref:L,D-transpeptidase family protein n=1 Tax=Streptomyces chilikensis TaxID=1194079 RepID=UPI0014085720|nr:L,D-transpeptidase [Streptomyces chilikensis]